MIDISFKVAHRYFSLLKYALSQLWCRKDPAIFLVLTELLKVYLIAQSAIASENVIYD